MAEDILGKVSKVEEISDAVKIKQLDTEIEPADRIPPNKDHFDALMSLDQQRTPTVVKTMANEGGSLMDQIRSINGKVEAVSRASPQDLVAQTQAVIKQIDQVKAQLATPNLELKSSVQALMKNKLSHIDESLKVAMNRAGLEYTPHQINPKDNVLNPIEHFIGFLTHGQYQLQRLSNDVEMMSTAEGGLSPASMIAMQLKVTQVTQQIELFIALLNKALESTKTIMNVQI